MVEGQLIDHHPEADGAGGAGQGGQVNVGGGHVAHRGSLVLDGEVVLVAHLLRFLCAPDVLVVDIGGQGEIGHLMAINHIVDSQFRLGHRYCLPSLKTTMLWTPATDTPRLSPTPRNYCAVRTSKRWPLSSRKYRALPPWRSPTLPSVSVVGPLPYTRPLAFTCSKIPSNSSSET